MTRIYVNRRAKTTNILLIFESKLSPAPISQSTFVARQIVASLLPGSGSKKQLFRPVQPTELTTPNVAMIMYQLYWSKYFLYLRRKGFNLDDRQAVSRSIYSVYPSPPVRVPPMGIIAKCAWVKEELGGDIETFDRFFSKGPQGWLFDDLNWSEGLVRASKNALSGDMEEAVRTINAILGTRPKRILREQGRNSRDLLDRANKRKARDHGEYLSILTDEIGKLLRGKFHKGFPLGFNLNFTRNCVCDGSIGVDSPSLRVLANDEYHPDCFEGLSNVEQECLLQCLGDSRMGRIILVSMGIDRFLCDYRGTSRHEFDSCYQTLKDRNNEKAVVDLIGDFLPEKVSGVHDLILKTSLGWDINTFLFAGEKIARYLLKSCGQGSEGVVTVELRKIGQALDSAIFSTQIQDCSARFIDIIEQLRRDVGMRTLLEELSSAYETGKYTLFRHLSVLVRGVERGTHTERIFASLCSLNEDVEFSGSSLIFYDFEDTDPVFTGYDMFMKWSEGLLGRI